MMPKMTGDGILVAGDAAAMCLAAGIWLEGVNFAMASGLYAGEAAVEREYDANTEEAIEREVFGVPWFIHEGVPYWGQDRIDFLERALAG